MPGFCTPGIWLFNLASPNLGKALCLGILLVQDRWPKPGLSCASTFINSNLTLALLEMNECADGRCDLEQVAWDHGRHYILLCGQRRCS